MIRCGTRGRGVFSTGAAELASRRLRHVNADASPAERPPPTSAHGSKWHRQVSRAPQLPPVYKEGRVLALPPHPLLTETLAAANHCAPASALPQIIGDAEAPWPVQVAGEDEAAAAAAEVIALQQQRLPERRRLRRRRLPRTRGASSSSSASTMTPSASSASRTSSPSSSTALSRPSCGCGRPAAARAAGLSRSCSMGRDVVRNRGRKQKIS